MSGVDPDEFEFEICFLLKIQLNSTGPRLL